MPREQKEVIGNRVDHPISDVHATALLSNVSPNAVEIRFDLYRSGPPSAEPCLLGIKPFSCPLFYFVGQIPRILLGHNHAAFPSRQRSFRRINSTKNFCPRALAFFPERQSLCHGVLGAVKPAGLDTLTYKSFLVGC